MKSRVIRAAIAAVALAACAASAAAQSTMTPQQVERRYRVRVFSENLVSAARYGAELMGLRVQQIDPSIILLSGTAPRAHGFVVEGHGVFFHVEIPNVDPVVAWAVSARGRDQVAIAAINDFRRYVQSVANAQERQMLEQRLQQLEQRFAPNIQRVSSTATPGTAPSPSAAPARPLDNPDGEYERLVTEQLVNAMLDSGHQLGLGADEWLTVAARGSQGPLVPDAVFQDTVTIQLRIKGSDLADFRTGRLTREEARARVVISEF